MRVVSDAGTVAEFSREVPFEVPAEKLDAALAGAFAHAEDLSLPPGRYTFESVARDLYGARISAKRAVLVVPAPAPAAVALSDLIMIRRLDPVLGDGGGPRNPLRVADREVVPSLSAVVARGSGDLSLYFVVYPDAQSTDPPSLAIEFLRFGAPAGRTTPALPEPDAEGRIPYIATTPAADLEAGEYEVRVTATQSGKSVERHMMLTVR